MDIDQQNDTRLHTIQQVAQASGVSSRTLRYYDQINLLPAAGTSSTGQRLYDSTGLVRLQRILLLRATGLELKTIAAILDHQRDEKEALTEHIEDLRRQRGLIDRRIQTLQHTIRKLELGGEMQPDESFEGFNEQYRDEVVERWGADSYRASDQWWKSLPETARKDFMEHSSKLVSRWVAAGNAGLTPDSPEAQRLAGAHIRWLASIPGTPAAGGKEAMNQYVRSLAQMYVADARFAATYQGQAQFVHDALVHHLDRH